MEIKDTSNSKPLANILLQVMGFALSYIRNILFLASAMMIFAVFVVIQIFFQDELNLNVLGYILISIDNLPILGNYISINEEMHVDENDLTRFFLYLSLIFTIVTEAIHYFRLYVLKIEPRETRWGGLKRRMLLALMALTFMYIAVFSYVIWQTGDVSGGIFVFVLFWIISVGSSLLFILFDFLTKKLRKVKV